MNDRHDVKPGLLILMDYPDRPSHLWMRRMVDDLRDATAVVASFAGVAGAGERDTKAVRLLDVAASRVLRNLGKGGVPVDSWAARLNGLRLAQALRDPRVSVALVHFLTLAIRSADVWASTSKPVFIYCHGYDVTWDLRHPDRQRTKAHPDDYVPRVLALPPNVRFIANSNATKSRLLGIGIDDSRVSVNYLGVPVPAAPPVKPPKRHGIDILYIGRLVDCKGPDLVIQAFDLACNRGLDATLTIAGDGPMWIPCQLLVSRSKYRNRIRMLGAVDATTGQRLRDSADIFTAHNCTGPLTNQVEAFGVSVVEAMAAALPVVSGASGALPEVVSHGVDGILVEPEDVDAHADALTVLARDPDLRLRLGLRGFEVARERFDITDSNSRLAGILGLANSSGKAGPW